MVSVRSIWRRASERVRADLRADPSLLWLLGLATVLSGFFFWHRLPNTATRDEWSRLLDPLVAFRSVVADPSFDGLKEGVAWGRVPFGATFYLFGLALVPAIAVAILTGQLDAITGSTWPDHTFGYYQLWQETPAWFWTLSLLVVRLFTVVFAAGAVYLTYRIGTVIANRSTGRLAGLLLTLTFGFLMIAHEGGEDMPALFFLLLALYLLVRYVQDGERLLFLAASAAGGVAIAFKLTSAPIVALVGLAHVLRAWNENWPRSLVRPRLLATGAGLGFVAIVLGFPTALVGDVGFVIERVFGGPVGRATHTTGPDAPVWWWFLRGYFSGLGFPLFVAGVGGALATLVLVARRRANAGMLLVVSALVAFVGLFVPWHDFRVHHLLPTFPLVGIVVAVWLIRFGERWPTASRVLTAILVVSSLAYAAVGVAGYADMPRDRAVDWQQEHVDAGETIEVYRVHFQDTALHHGASVTHRWESFDPCAEYIQLGYRDLLYLHDETYLRNHPWAREYIRSLLAGEYGYEIAAEFGPRPPNFVPQRPTPGSLTDLFRLGVMAQTDQYADEQELRPNQYTVILERTGECDQDRNPPF